MSPAVLQSPIYNEFLQLIFAIPHSPRFGSARYTGQHTLAGLKHLNTFDKFSDFI